MRPVVRGLAIPGLALLLAACAGHSHPRFAQRPGEPPPGEPFFKYDTNHDGKVTRAELETGLRAEFNRYDLDHNGCLDEKELMALNQARWERDASAASPVIDFRNTGCVDYDEYAATMRSLFDELDINGDGVLEPDELRPGAARSGQARNAGNPVPGRGRGRHGGRQGGDEGE